MFYLLQKINLNSGQKDAYVEKVTIGKLAWKTYLQYFYTGGGICGASIFFLILIIGTTFISASDYWINVWASSENIDYLDKISKVDSLNGTCGLNCTDLMKIPVYENRDRDFAIYNGNSVFFFFNFHIKFLNLLKTNIHSFDFSGSVFCQCKIFVLLHYLSKSIEKTTQKNV